MRCGKCQGSGFYMDFGQMRQECDCEDMKPKKPVKLDRRSVGYKEAIDKIMQSNDCEREEAIRIFDSEFDKIA